MNNISLSEHAVDGKNTKNIKGRSLKSLFEIRRPKKKGLQRTNSLPAQPIPVKLDTDHIPNITRTIPLKYRERVRPHTLAGVCCDVDEENHSMKLHSVTEENRPESDLESGPATDQSQYVTVNLENYETECELACDYLSDKDMSLTNTDEHILNSESSDIKPGPNMESIRYFLTLPKAQSCMALNSTEESRLDSPVEDIFRHEDNKSFSSILSCNNAEDLPFWLTNKSFIHKTTHDEEIPSEENIVNEDIEKHHDSEENANIQQDLEKSSIKKPLFMKNTEGRSSRNKVQRKRTGIMLKEKSVKEIASTFEGFRDANNNGATENYRKSLIQEMDRANDRMLKDGFDSNMYLSMESLNIEDTEEEKCDDILPELEHIDYKEIEARNINMRHKIGFEDKSDIFGTMAFNDNIEDGLYFVEAYNRDNDELVICSLKFEKLKVTFSEIESEENFLKQIENQEALVINEGSESNDSKRSTIYSITSTESLEYFVNEEAQEEDNSCNSQRRETITDDKGVVRIERVNLFQDPINNENSSTSREISASEPEELPNNIMSFQYSELEHQIVIGAPIPKKSEIQYILEEILATERKYVKGLKQLLDDYYVFLFQFYPEKAKIIFGNIVDIYKLQSNFLETLEMYGPQLKGVTRAFIDYEVLFHHYPKYMRNAPKANATVRFLNDVLKTRQEELKNKLGISAYLVTPIQRLGKYTLFFGNIIKRLTKENQPTGEAEFALSIVKKYMRKGNDAVAIDSIEKNPIEPKYYGSFIMNEKFTILKPKRLDSTVFLFEQIIVFTYELDTDRYIYYKSIFTNDLRIATFDDSNQIHLTDFNKEKRYKSKCTFVLEAKNAKIRDTWKNEIEKILWNQLYKVKAKSIADYSKKTQSLPRNHKRKDEKKSVKANTIGDTKRSTSIGKSTFYQIT
ncbi:uncharacterized protein LOC143194107 [Rhynchophorus ferrugineus]|uniref:uncharacterized protein LOC143194107 n=1 Tax=Rhynchophorus ferrugineus TaxID=354439 RepID=UPI003FCC5A48